MHNLYIVSDMHHIQSNNLGNELWNFRFILKYYFSV